MFVLLPVAFLLPPFLTPLLQPPLTPTDLHDPRACRAYQRDKTRTPEWTNSTTYTEGFVLRAVFFYVFSHVLFETKHFVPITHPKPNYYTLVMPLSLPSTLGATLVTKIRAAAKPIHM